MSTLDERCRAAGPGGVLLVGAQGEAPAPVEAPVAPAAEPTRDQVRSRRHREVRGKTINIRRETKRERELLRVLYPDTDHERPATRAECVDGVRPCPYVGCEFNLYLDIARKGNLHLNFPDLEPDELGESCVLDCAEDGGRSLDAIARDMNLTRERVRQLEERALKKLRDVEAILRRAVEGE